MGMTCVMVAYNGNFSPNSSPSSPTYPLEVEIVGKWKCSGKRVDYGQQDTTWEFYDNGDFMGWGSTGNYSFMSSNNIKIQWSDTERFRRYDIAISEGELTMDNIKENWSCQRL